MTPVEPDTPRPLRTEWMQVNYAKDQPQYLPLPALRSRDGRVISEWALDHRECELLKAILDNYFAGIEAPPRIALMHHTFNEPLQPIRVQIGPFEEPFVQTSADIGHVDGAPHGR